MSLLWEEISRLTAKLPSFPKEQNLGTLLQYSVGAFSIYATVKSASFLWKFYFRPFPSLRAKYAGTWSVITGSTGGIGLGIAHQLAAQGINIVLIARNKVGLDTTAAELRSRFPSIEVRVVSLEAEGNVDFTAVTTVIRDLNVSLLFNNVGVHNHIPTNVVDMDHQDIRRIVDVNCTFQVQLTSVVIPQMKHHAQYKTSTQGRPAVINVSSLTSKMAMPLLSVYAATKAFEEHWTVGLGAELEPLGIDVMCLRPGLTVSAMSGESTPSLFCPSAETMARACVRMIGSGELSVAPYAPHALLDFINQLVPRCLTWPLVRDMHEKKRKELLDKRK